MNPTRQELLSGLEYVYDILQQIEGILVEDLSMKRKYLAEQKTIGTASVTDRTKLAITAAALTLVGFFSLIWLLTGQVENIILLGVCGFIIYKKRGQRSKLKIAAYVIVACCACFMVRLLFVYLNPGIALILLLVMAVAIALEFMFITGRNRYVASFNLKASRHNAEVNARRNELWKSYKRLETQLQTYGPAWYPPDYCSVGCAGYFLYAVRNGRADTVKEMVNLFHHEMEYQEMLACQREQNDLMRGIIRGQEDIKRQLRFANILGMANLALSMDTNARVGNVENQVGGIRNEVSGMGSRMDGMRSEISGLRGAVNESNRKVDRVASQVGDLRNRVK